MKDDKLCISPDALIAMIVTEAQDRALAQMPGPEAPLGEVQASDAFLRRMDALVHTANRRANRQYGRLAIKRFLVALATALSLFSCTLLPVKAEIVVAIAPLQLKIVLENVVSLIAGIGHRDVKLYQLVPLRDCDITELFDCFRLATGEIKQRGVHSLIRFCTGRLCPAAASQQQGRRQN